MELRKHTMLPYPVFGIEGDYDCERPSSYFAISADSDDKKHIITITIKFDQKAIKNILDKIESKDAVLSFEIDCKHTLYRYCKQVEVGDCRNGMLMYDIELSKVHFAKEVSITPFITAVKDFKLTGKSFNPAYGKNPTFSIQKGDVLAVFDKIQVNMSMNWNHMYENAGAPIKIVENDVPNAIIETRLSDEIIILLPKKEYNNFKRNLEQNSAAAPIVLMSLARPAVMTALLDLRNNPEQDRSWAMALKQRISTDDAMKDFCPEDGNWNSSTISWSDEAIEKIASLIFKGAEAKMFKNLVMFTNSMNED